MLLLISLRGDTIDTIGSSIYTDPIERQEENLDGHHALAPKFKRLL